MFNTIHVSCKTCHTQHMPHKTYFKQNTCHKYMLHKIDVKKNIIITYNLCNTQFVSSTIHVTPDTFHTLYISHMIHVTHHTCHTQHISNTIHVTHKTCHTKHVTQNACHTGYMSHIPVTHNQCP